LHDAGHLERAHTSHEAITAALRASVALVDRLSAEEGFGPNAGDILVTDGERMVAVHRNGTMLVRVLKGKSDVEELLGEDSGKRTRIPSVESTHFTLIVSEADTVPLGFGALEGRSLVSLTRTDEPLVEPL
jgi:hypothetical protein